MYYQHIYFCVYMYFIEHCGQFERNKLKQLTQHGNILYTKVIKNILQNQHNVILM